MPPASGAEDFIEPAGGVIEGVVFDPELGGIGNANVRLVGERVVVVASADKHGWVAINGLPPGRYRLSSHAGS